MSKPVNSIGHQDNWAEMRVHIVDGGEIGLTGIERQAEESIVKVTANDNFAPRMEMAIAA